MPDISMCKFEECGKKQTCYRYIAKPSEYRQSYFMGMPPHTDGTCDFYWEAVSKSQMKRLDIMTDDNDLAAVTIAEVVNFESGSESDSSPNDFSTGNDDSGFSGGGGDFNGGGASGDW